MAPRKNTSNDRTDPDTDLEYEYKGEKKLKVNRDRLTPFIYLLDDRVGLKEQGETYDAVKDLFPSTVNKNERNTTHVSFYKAGQFYSKNESKDITVEMVSDRTKPQVGMYIESPYNSEREFVYYYVGDIDTSGRIFDLYAKERTRKNGEKLLEKFEKRKRRDFIELLEGILVKDGRYGQFEYRFELHQSKTKHIGVGAGSSYEGTSVEVTGKKKNDIAITKLEKATLKNKQLKTYAVEDFNGLERILNEREKGFLKIHQKLKRYIQQPQLANQENSLVFSMNENKLYSLKVDATPVGGIFGGFLAYFKKKRELSETTYFYWRTVAHENPIVMKYIPVSIKI